MATWVIPIPKDKIHILGARFIQGKPAEGNVIICISAHNDDDHDDYGEYHYDYDYDYDGHCDYDYDYDYHYYYQ